MFFAAFCLLSGFLVLARTFRTEAADVYTIDVTANDSSMGGFSYGSDCSGTIYSNYHATAEYNYQKPFPNNGSILACPAEGYSFGHWLVNGVMPANGDPYSPVFHDWMGDYDSNKEMNIEAVFSVPKTAEIYAPNGTAGVSWHQNVTVTNNQSSHVTATMSKAETITVTASYDANTYIINTSNPVSTTGGVTYNSDYSNGTFTLTISGSGTATVNIVPISGGTYNVTITTNNSAWGDIRLVSDSNYSVSPDNTDTDTITITADPSSGQVTTSNLIITPATGYRLAQNSPITVTSGQVSCQMQNNTCTLQFSDAASMTVNFEEIPVYTTNISTNDSLKGVLALGGDCSATKVNTATETSENAQATFPSGSNNSITACPRDGFTFDHWELNSATPAQDASAATIYKYTSWVQSAFSGGVTTANIVAVFTGNHHDYNVSFQTNVSAAGDLEISNSSSDYAVVPDGTPADNITVTANTEDGWVQLDAVIVTEEQDWEFVDFTISNSDNIQLVSSDPTTGSYVFRISGPGTVTANYQDTSTPTMTIGVNNPSAGSFDIESQWCDPTKTQTTDVTVPIIIANSTATLDVPSGWTIHACVDSSSGATFSHWELDGVLYTTNSNFGKTSQDFILSGHHELRAVFSGGSTPTVYTLPFTGSFTIWLIIGGGIGLVAIPSVILIINERKEQKKGGKK